MNLFARTDRSSLGQWWWTIDRPILSAIAVLVVFGIVLVAMASPPVAQHLGIGDFYFFKRHLIVLIPSLVMMMAVSTLSPKQIWRLSSILFFLSMLALVAVLFVGDEIKGARRWIRIMGFSLQPSEFVKPLFLIVAAWYMSLNASYREMSGLYISAGLYLIVISLLLMQPDLGMTLIVTAAFGIQIFLAGLPLRIILVLLLLALISLFLAYFTFDHVGSRINRFLNPESGDNYQVEQSVQAFQQGGFFGKGPGQGTVKLNLPDAHADFIFSVAGEELGFLFLLVIISAFGFMILRGFHKLMSQENVFVILAGGGLLAMYGLQAFVHMGSSLNILPAKGMTLPFISYGGSSLLSTCLAAGVILAFTRRPKAGRSYGAKKSSGSLFLSARSAKKL